MNNKVFLFLSGSVCLILGITLILKNWVYVAVLFQGAVGIVLALSGLIILVYIKD